MLEEIKPKIVDIKEVVRMLKARQGERTPEAFACIIGIPANTLRAYYSGRRTIGAPNARVLIEKFQELSDFEMSEAVSTYFRQKVGI